MDRVGTIIDPDLSSQPYKIGHEFGIKLLNTNPAWNHILEAI